MGSLFDTLFGSLSGGAFASRLGESVTYRPQGTTGASDVLLTARLGRVSSDDDVSHGYRSRLSMTVTFDRDPSGTYGGVSSPAVEDVVIVGGVEWVVASIESLSASEAVVRVARVALDDVVPE